MTWGQRCDRYTAGYSVNIHAIHTQFCSEVIARISGCNGYTSTVDVLTTLLQSTLHTSNGNRDRYLHIVLPTRNGYGLILGACRSVAGKHAAAARTRDAKQISSATQYSYLSTVPSPGLSPCDMGIHAPAGVYAAKGGWAHRWPSSPPFLPPSWAPLGTTRNARAPGELKVRTRSASPGKRRSRLTRFTCHSALALWVRPGNS